MFDLRFIRSFPDKLDAGLARRGHGPMADFLLELDKQHRQTLTDLQAFQGKRNKLAKAFGQAKAKGEDTAALAHESELTKQHIQALENQAQHQEQRLHDTLSRLPNIPDDAVPAGVCEADNRLVDTWGEPARFAFTPKHHYELGHDLGQMDFEGAAKLAGSRFVVLKGDLARLERALANFMLDIHTREFGYTEINPPLLVREDVMFGTGQLPKFHDDQFKTEDGRWLIPTAEVVLTNLVAGEILHEAELPLRYVAYTPCFRAEAGAAGRDTRGMIRQHQFNKVELVSITSAQQSDAEHERMTTAAETVLRRLGLPYRKMLLCCGDMGFCARKTYDLEVWMPAQNQYREISSCSNCAAFQGRRMNARYRPSSHDHEEKLSHVHTLNGSGLAVGRTMIAVMENYQQEDGTIAVPEVLRPWFGKDVIG